MIDRVTFEKTTYAPPPARFEAGTPHVVGVIGLHAAIDYVEGIGLDAIAAHEAALVREARDALARINSVRLFGPEDSAGIVSFAVEGVHPHDVGTILDEEQRGDPRRPSLRPAADGRISASTRRRGRASASITAGRTSRRWCAGSSG